MQLHPFQRANYQTLEWKSALIANHVFIDPTDHGWERVADGRIDIMWNTLKPAPDALLEFVACNCKKNRCVNNKCRCQKAYLKCTDLCGCNDSCENIDVQSDTDESENYDESGSEDDEDLDELD